MKNLILLNTGLLFILAGSANCKKSMDQNNEGLLEGDEIDIIGDYQKLLTSFYSIFSYHEKRVKSFNKADVMDTIDHIDNDEEYNPRGYETIFGLGKDLGNETRVQPIQFRYRYR